MAIAQGIFKQVVYKKETTFGVKPVASGASALPRTDFTLNLTKETFQSNRMALHQQSAGTRHGTRHVEGTYNDEISCATHKDIWAALLRKTWVNGTVSPAAPGHLFVPQSGHTDDSFTFEEWRSDITTSQIYTGVKVTQAQVNVQPSGMATVGFSLMGQDMESSIGSTRYFTTPTALPGNTPASGAVGELRIDSTAVAVVTAADFTINGGGTTEGVLGSAVSPDVFRDIIRVTGRFSLFHKDKTLLEKYIQEQAISLIIKLDEPGGTHFIRFTMPKVLIGSYQVNDVPSGAVASCQFNADMNEGGVDDKAKSIILIEDSRITA